MRAGHSFTPKKAILQLLQKGKPNAKQYLEAHEQHCHSKHHFSIANGPSSELFESSN
jgi:hypothetical protein